MFMLGGIAGYSGFTPKLYGSLSDRQITDLLFGARDDDGRIITEAAQEARRRGEKTGSPKDAKRELPSRESLEIPDEAFCYGRPGSRRGIPMGFVVAWWQVWRIRNIHTTEELLARWREYVARYGMKPLQKK